MNNRDLRICWRMITIVYTLPMMLAAAYVGGMVYKEE